MSKIRSMADQLGKIQNRADFWDSALTLLPSLGLSKVVFLDLTSHADPVVCSNAGHDWDIDYTASVVSGDDPFAGNCLSSIAPMMTGIEHLEAHRYLDDTARDLIAQGSHDLGIRTGMSVTICPHSAGAGIGWNLMSNRSVMQFADMRAEHEADWRAWCQLTYAGLSMPVEGFEPSHLTTREQDCLAYVADGMRTADVAHRLSIAETTVEMHLRNARNRLGAKTRDQAVALAIRRRLI